MDIAFSNYQLPEKKSGAKDPRADLIEEFFVVLDKDRKEYNWKRRINKLSTLKNLTRKDVAIKLSHLDLEELRWFFKKCNSADNFSKCFFGLLKKK